MPGAVCQSSKQLIGRNSPFKDEEIEREATNTFVEHLHCEILSRNLADIIIGNAPQQSCKMSNTDVILQMKCGLRAIK